MIDHILIRIEAFTLIWLNKFQVWILDKLAIGLEWMQRTLLPYSSFALYTVVVIASFFFIIRKEHLYNACISTCSHLLACIGSGAEKAMATARITLGLVGQRTTKNQFDFTNYVSRVHLETRMDKFFDQSKPSYGCYLVVYGPKGSGKTTLVGKVLQTKSNSIFIRVREEHTIVSLSEHMAEVYQDSGVSSAGDFKSQLRNCFALYRVTPIIIFEIERSAKCNSSDKTLDIVRSLAHEYCKLALIAIVISDTSAVVHMRRDLARETFLVVNEFLPTEAKTLLTLYNRSITEEETDLIVNKMGCRPGVLMRTLAECNQLNVEDVFENYAKAVRDSLISLQDHPTLKVLLQLLNNNNGAVSLATCTNPDLRAYSDTIRLLGDREAGDLIFYDMVERQYVTSSPVVLRELRIVLNTPVPSHHSGSAEE